MTYEEHLDEVTTLITEKYGLGDQEAIRMVMRAQADDFFSGHDDDASICTQERAEADARAVFRKYGAGQKPAGTKAPPRQGQGQPKR